ncbi:TetR/AcrR family transcriptional regulator [Microbacterium aerolatum]|nr:TetR family transcriptional regulator [Microbacterium aerolatum]MCK3769506.1 TetR family transcriptional regulator [Microbacterium aerolatum]
MPPSAGSPANRTRPRDRKRHIQEAAAAAFSRNGYHVVGMQDIADAVGISAPALYRHFPNKYALFVTTAFALVQQLIEATDEAAAQPVETATDARAALDELLDAVIATTVELRAVGGIYRWEGRYLEAEDRERLTAQFRMLRERFEEPHRIYRPEIDEEQRRLIVLASLSVVASITAHRAVLAARSLRALLKEAAWRMLDADTAATAYSGEGGDLIEQVDSGTGRRAQLLDTAVRLFAARGYNEVTIEDLAVEVDLTPSGVYRHFDGKPAVLLAACDRAAVVLERAVLRVRESSSTPEEALRRLCRAYVDHSFRNRALMRVYFSELGNLSPEDQRRLRAMQRAHVADWTALLQSVRPELGGREAAVLVHAGFSVITDEMQQLTERDEAAAVRLTALVEALLEI